MNSSYAPMYPVSMGLYNENVSVPFIANRNPTPTDLNFPRGKRWINPINNTVFSFLNVTFSGLVKSAVWTPLNNSQINVVNTGLSPNLSGANTTVPSANTFPGDLVFLSLNQAAGTIANTAVNQVDVGSFSIHSSAGNTSNYNFLVVN